MNAGFPALRLADHDVFTALAVLCCACLGMALAAGTVGSDSWLSLLGGRIVLEHGLPMRDTLTVWSQGRRWVDQQWLAQVAMYGLFTLGGLSLLVLATLGATISCVGALVALARRRGATATSTALTTVALFFLVLPSAAVRAQTLVYPLLAVILWLLWGTPKGPTARRIALTLPALVLWANLHGSVLLGVGLASLAAAEAAYALRDARLLGFVPLAVAAVFASPYGFDLVHYYRTVLLNPGFGKLVTEWRSPTPAHQPIFFAAAVLSIGLVAARRRRFRPSELAAFALTTVGGFVAVRNIVWFALVALVLVPRTFDVPSTSQRRSAINVALLGAATAFAAVFAVSVASRSDAQLSPSYPAAALRAVERSPGPTWADDRYADWLLFKVPSRRGHVLFDARFELLTQHELTRIAQFRVQGAGAVLVPRASREAACLPGRVLYRDHSVVLAAVSAGARTAVHRNC